MRAKSPDTKKESILNYWKNVLKWKGWGQDDVCDDLDGEYNTFEEWLNH